MYYNYNKILCMRVLTPIGVLFNLNLLLAATDQWQTSVEVSTLTSLPETDYSVTQTNSLHESLDAYETLRRTFKGVEKLVYRLLNEDFMYQDSNEVLSELTYNAEQSLEVIGGQLFNIGSTILTDIFKRLQLQVSEMQLEFQHMTEKMESTFEWAVNYANLTLMNHSEDIDMWAENLKQNLRSINDTELYKNGCKQVDEFVEFSTKLLTKCCHVTIKPLKSFCWKSRSIVADTLNLLVDIFERIQICLEDQQSYTDYMVPCLNLAYNNLNNLIKRAVVFRQKLESNIPFRLMISRQCFAIALVHIEEHQSALTRNLTSFK